MAFKIESSLLDACALAILHRGDTYGYEITQEMKKSITVSESTLYPVLRRLQKEELCMTYDQPYQGRNRRYYRITEKGEAQLSEYLKQWDEYRNAVQTLLYGSAKEPAKDSVKAEPETEPAKAEAEEPKSGSEKKSAKDKSEKKPAKKTKKEKPERSAGDEETGIYTGFAGRTLETAA